MDILNLVSRSQAIVVETEDGYNTADRIGNLFKDISVKVIEMAVSVKDFGAIGNGIVDDSISINNAITDVSNLGGGVLKIPKGTYNMGGSGRLFLKSNVSIVGEPGTVIDFSQRTTFATVHVPLITAFGTIEKNSVIITEPLTENASTYGNILSFNTSEFADGNMILLYREAKYYNAGTNTRYGELCIIKKIINGSSAELSNGLIYDYPVSDGAAVQLVYAPIENVTISGIKFIGKGNNVVNGVWGQADHGFQSRWAKNITVESCTFTNIQRMTCMFIHTWNFKAHKNIINFNPLFNDAQIQYGIYYGNGTCYGDVFKNDIINGKHAIVDGFIDSGTANELKGGITHHINVHHNNGIGQWSASISEHWNSSFYMDYHNNHLVGVKYGIDLRNSKVKCNDNTIICSNITVVGETITYGIAIKESLAEAEICRNKIYGASYGIVDNDLFGDSPVVNNDILIQGNYFKDIGTIGVRLYDTHNINRKENIRITSNIFRNCVMAISMYGHFTGKIDGNELYDITGNSAIWLRGVVNFSLENNRMTRVKTPILIQDGVSGGTPLVSNNVLVKNNHYWDFTGHITNNATGVVVIRDNLNYITENKGTATVVAGATYITINHGLSITPDASKISVTPTNNMNSATKFWVSHITSTQFRINTNVDPTGTGATFAWQIN